MSAKLGRGPESVKAKANKTEAKLAERLGGKRQPASGAVAGHKGDVKLEHFLLDSKETSGGSIMVSRADVVKITREATGENKQPALVFTFHTIADSTPREWVMLPLDTFAAMIENGQDEEL